MRMLSIVAGGIAGFAIGAGVAASRGTAGACETCGESATGTGGVVQAENRAANGVKTFLFSPESKPVNAKPGASTSVYTLSRDGKTWVLETDSDAATNDAEGDAASNETNRLAERTRALKEHYDRFTESPPYFARVRKYLKNDGNSFRAAEDVLSRLEVLRPHASDLARLAASQSNQSGTFQLVETANGTLMVDTRDGRTWRLEKNDQTFSWVALPALPGAATEPREAPTPDVTLRPRAWLGVSSERAYEDPNAPGVRLTKVYEGTAAETAGLRVGDIVTAAEGRSIMNNSDLANIIAGKKPGDALKIVILRDGMSIGMDVTLGEKLDLSYFGMPESGGSGDKR